MSDIIGQSEIVDKLSKEFDITKSDLASILDAFVNVVVGYVSSGDVVRVKNLGTFDAAERAAREARNPQTGEVIQVPQRMAPRFRPAKSFKEAISSMLIAA